MLRDKPPALLRCEKCGDYEALGDAVIYCLVCTDALNFSINTANSIIRNSSKSTIEDSPDVPSHPSPGESAGFDAEVERLAAAMNDAQITAQEIALGHDLRIPARRILATFQTPPDALRKVAQAFVTFWDTPPYMSSDREIADHVDAFRAALKKMGQND